MSGARASAPQVAALRLVLNFSEGGSFMPDRGQYRTCLSCVARGWLVETAVSRGDRYNGFALTDEGRRIAESRR